MKLYDQEHNRLVYLHQEATADFWDDHWDNDQFKKGLLNPNNNFVNSNTMKFLPAGAKVLEGGCGIGDKVASLKKVGFDSLGIDFAEKTVTKAKEILPELNIVKGDVRALDLQNDSFDGYWSLGVIEHFPTGYDDISKEMHRVLKKDGYLFLTVPALSPLRKLKAKLKSYEILNQDNFDHNKFYQFAFSHDEILKSFEDLGFKLIKYEPYDGIKGLKDEVPLLKKFLQLIYDGNSLPIKIIRKLINIGIQRFSNHMHFFVFQKIN